MIGRHVTAAFSGNGNQLTLLVRKPFPTDRAHKISLWNPDKDMIYPSEIENQDIVIHLAGKNLDALHWSDSHKRAILESRTRSTDLLSRTLAKLKQPPKLMLAASAIGFYGNRPASEVLDETCATGDGFMADVCRQWEDATLPAQEATIRVVNMRFGLVLSPSGGTVAKMMPFFKLGLGGKIGRGDQVMSWIALEEIPAVLTHIVQHPNLTGPVNVVSPNPVTNADFAKLLARALSRPSIFALPKVGAKLAFGEMADELLLSGARVVPQKLLESGYQFQYPELEDTFQQMFVKAS